ncbi:MAG: hypothetical protein RSD54_04505 [Ruthenibacterium sp.]
MIQFCKIALSRLFSGVRLLVALALLLLLPAGMIYVNYTVDCSGYFQGEQYLRDVANMVLAGKDIVGYEKLNDLERDVMKILANNMEPMPDYLALGSSRVLQLSRKVMKTDSFFNCGMTGGDARDVLDTFYLFDREDRLPKTIIIGFDPWLLRDDADAFDKRSDTALYATFLSEKLGIETTFEKPDAEQKWTALFSPSYFQNNISYLQRDSDGADKPKPVSGNLYAQGTEVKCGDGSLLYTAEFRNQTQEAINFSALNTCNFVLRLEGYPKLGIKMPEVFDKFFAYAKERNVNIVLLLAPFHPIVYDHLVENAEKYGGFMQTEPAVRKLAAKYDFEVFGSYNPYAIDGVTEADFYDGLHCTAGCLDKIIWGKGVTNPDAKAPSETVQTEKETEKAAKKG